MVEGFVGHQGEGVGFFGFGGDVEFDGRQYLDCVGNAGGELGEHQADFLRRRRRR